MSIKTCVTLYSFQDEFMHHRMDLNDLLDYLRDHKIDGMEILPDQMIHGTPHPDEETLADWDRLLAAHPEVAPVCADVFLNTNLYQNRTLTQRECVDMLIDEIKLAHRLGFKLMRFVSMIPGFVIEPLLPYCERYGMTIALEIHAGMSFGIPETRGWIEEMKRVDSPYCGLVVDTGIFCHRIPRVFNDFNVKILGVNPDIVAYFNSFFDQGLDGRSAFTADHQMKPELAKMATGRDIPYIMLADGYENTPLSVLDEYWKHIKHFHFKLWEMVDGEEYSIDYKTIIQYLHDRGYDGYVSTEYEGNRWTLPGNPIDEKGQVAAHQAMIRRYIEEIEG